MRRFAILAFVFTFTLAAQQAPKPATPPQQQPPIPREQAIERLWAALLAGNKTFVAGNISFTDLKADRAATKDVQVPPVTILSCSDSRVPPELIFNQSLGALFVVRTAGNVADEMGVASIEFAILHNWTNLIVVLGHDNCGAVKAALGGADPNTRPLTALANRIRMSFVGVPYDSTDPANVRKAAEANARASVAHLLATSKVIRDAVLTEQVKIIAAFYDVATGEVRELK